MDAFNIAKDLSKCGTNVQRAAFVEELTKKQARVLGYELLYQDIDIDPKYGARNFILSSGYQNPLLITAHYDSYILDESSGLTSPGANDNGSGVGVIIESSEGLKGLPVDFVLFGAEEVGSLGAKHYISQMRSKPRAVVNLDTCGSGGALGILIPKSVYVEKTIVGVDEDLNSHFLAAANELGFRVYQDDPLATGDHCAFMQIGIPATTLQGGDSSYYGIVDGEYSGPKLMHTEKDTIEVINRLFLKQVVELLVEGSKRLLTA